MIIVAVQNNQSLPWESVISASCQPSYVITKSGRLNVSRRFVMTSFMGAFTIRRHLKAAGSLDLVLGSRWCCWFSLDYLESGY